MTPSNVQRFNFDVKCANHCFHQSVYRSTKLSIDGKLIPSKKKRNPGTGGIGGGTIFKVRVGGTKPKGALFQRILCNVLNVRKRHILVAQ